MSCGIRMGMFLGLILATGCGSGSQVLSPVDAQVQSKIDGLTEVGSLLTLYKTERHKAASKVEDLARYEPGLPVGYQRIKSGEVVVLWGAPVSEGDSAAVIAYEKTAPESGGYVLMQDGLTVKKMTAEEFKAAPKAAKG